MRDSILVLFFLIPLLIVVAYCSYWVATHGRKMTLPEEVTKGIKSDTPFPSPKSSHNSKFENYPQKVSNTNSSVININDTSYVPPNFSVDESTYVVKREFVPKSVDELPIKRNQIVTVKEIYEDGWCMAISITNGEMGVIPYQCLIKYNDLVKNQKQFQQQQLEKHLSKSSTTEDKKYFQPYVSPPILFNDKNDSDKNNNGKS
ncbi:hypothetical protein U3516DRAFT_829010 [Neocallimastix sp. 'constans']|jgi:hypothetical protein